MTLRIKELERQCWDPQTNHVNSERFAERLIRESADLLLRHADQLRQYRFETNAVTAESLAGTLLEHWGFKTVQQTNAHSVAK